MVVHRYGKASLGSLLTDYILIEIVNDLGRLGELVEGGRRVLLMHRIGLLRRLERLVDRLGTLVAEVADGTARHEVDHTLRSTADAAEVLVAKHPVVVTSQVSLLRSRFLTLCHYFCSLALVSTLSTSPYSIASLARSQWSRSESFSICSTV